MAPTPAAGCRDSGSVHGRRDRHGRHDRRALAHGLAAVAGLCLRCGARLVERLPGNQLANLVGTEIRLLGGGKGSLDDFESYLSHGCVLSFGEVPYPGDSSWLVALGSSEEQLFFVDVDGTVVVIRARHGSGDVEALWDYMREVIGTVEFG